MRWNEIPLLLAVALAFLGAALQANRDGAAGTGAVLVSVGLVGFGAWLALHARNGRNDD